MKTGRPGIAVWATALLAYGAFSAWYGGLGAPLRPAEVDAYMTRLAQGSVRDPALLAAVRAFLDSDDGREFFMVNLVQMQPGDIAVPGTDERESAARVLDRYSVPFLGALLRRTGHPAFGAPAAATYLEHWNAAPDPGSALAHLAILSRRLRQSKGSP
jgi:hypothetical protein